MNNQPQHIYRFKNKIWLYPGAAAWHFITVPPKLSAEIHTKYAQIKRGWGSLKVEVKIGTTRWQTSIFPDNKTKTYLLPVKASVRKLENLAVDKVIAITLQISNQ